jgi:hypothetical protein
MFNVVIKPLLQIFDSIKPLMLKDAHAKIKATVDESLVNALGDSQIPNSISPIDFAIAEARKQVRAKKYVIFKLNKFFHGNLLSSKF